jgi:hypothetical protein
MMTRAVFCGSRVMGVVDVVRSSRGEIASLEDVFGCVRSNLFSLNECSQKLSASPMTVFRSLPMIVWKE